MDTTESLKANTGFRFYYDKDLDFLFNEEKEYNHNYIALIRAKKRLRMYANLFNRDMRKILINNNSVCVKCGSNEKLQIDHIISIEKGGKNEKSNVQILCFKCNRIKSNK